MHYTTYAFISYSHRDMSFAKWLQKRLEAFRLPTEIHNDIEAGNPYLRPIFRDQSDLNTGILGEELRHHLEESKFLILICTKYSAQSAWVSDEAKAFVDMGRLDHIIPVIIPDDTIPDRDLFPRFLRDYFRKYPDMELLGINIGEEGREKPLIRVVSKMLGVSFDSLWKRHRRRTHIRILTASVSALAAAAAAYLFAVPVSITVSVGMQQADLPVGEEVTLIVNGGEYSAPTSAPQFDRISIPGHRRFSFVDICARSKFFSTFDTVVPVGFGLSREVDIELKRDDTFATYAGSIYDSDMNPIEGVTVAIDRYISHSDAKGWFIITIPLAEQRVELPITLKKSGYIPILREDESPGRELKFIMHR